MLCGSMCGRLSDVKHGDIKTRGGGKKDLSTIASAKAGWELSRIV